MRESEEERKGEREACVCEKNKGQGEVNKETDWRSEICVDDNVRL